MQWFGVESVGMIRPLRLDVVEKALNPVRLTTVEVNGTEDRKVKARTVAGEEETVRALQALGNTGIRNPVFVSDKVYRLDKGKLAAGATARLEPFLINHDIGPRKTAYGAKGCRDCHPDNAAFFTKERVVNIGGFLKEYPEMKEPNAVSQMREWGFRSVPPIK